MAAISFKPTNYKLTCILYLSFMIKTLFIYLFFVFEFFKYKRSDESCWLGCNCLSVRCTSECQLIILIIFNKVNFNILMIFLFTYMFYKHCRFKDDFCWTITHFRLINVLGLSGVDLLFVFSLFFIISITVDPFCSLT